MRFFLTRYGDIIAGPFTSKAQARQAERDMNERATITRLRWERA